MAAQKSKQIETPELIELALVQGSAEWLAFRRQYRMASESPAIMGKSPYATAADVRRSKLSCVEKFQTAAMRQGTDQEPVARAAYEALFEPMPPAVLRRGEYGASLDGFALTGRRQLEIKVPWDGRESDRWTAAENSTTTEHDAIQIQHQLMVSGAEICDLWIWDVATQCGILVCVLPDLDMQAAICAAWDAFWPTLEEREDAEFLAAAEAWRAAKRAATEATDRLEAARDVLEKLSPTKHAFGGGVEITRSARIGNVEWKKIRADLLSGVSDGVIDSYRGPETETVTIKEVKK